MADPEHLAKLKEGIDAWNAWRAENPKLVPDLSRTDFSDRSEFEATHLWASHERARNGQIVAAEGVVLDRGDFSGVNFLASTFGTARAVDADFDKANLRRVNVTDTNFERSRFRSADFFRATLSHSSFLRADLTGAAFQYANFNGTFVGRVVYRRARLAGNCLGVMHAQAMYGHARFRRDVMDQDFIDDAVTEWTHPAWNPRRFLLLWPWALIDYGRSIWRVLALGALIIAGFGLAYPMMEAAGDIAYTADIGADNPFRPYYAAAIAFSTLGFTDIVIARSLAGQITLMANVLLGYATLGLLLAILANSVARRS